MFEMPIYQELPEVKLGQEIKLLLDSEGRKRRKVKGKVVCKTESILVIERELYRESICVVDFLTGHALICN